MRENTGSRENMPKVAEKNGDDGKSREGENHQRITQVHITDLKVVTS